MSMSQKDHNEWIVEQLSENPSLRFNKEWRMNNLYWIMRKDKSKGIFKMNRAQKHFFDTYLNVPNPWYRHVILKARQLGFTTFIGIWMLDEVLFNPNREGLMIAHVLKEANEIFDRKIDFAMRNLCEELKESLFKVSRNSAKKIQVTVDFGPDEGSTSSIQVSLSGRSGTFHYVHISEYAPMCIQFPKRAAEVKTGTFPAVPMDGYIFVESTAETMGDDFYQMFTSEWYQRDQITPLLSQFRFLPHFYNWTWDDEEMAKVGGIIPVEAMDECLEIDWAEYKKDNNLSDLEITYYYIKWQQLGKDVRKLNQQYPTVPEEAFLASGATYFPTRIVSDLLTRHVPGAKYDILNGEVVPNVYGDLEILQMPVKGRQYVIGGDTAEGIAHGDAQVMSVIDRATETVVAVWKSQITADEYPDMAIALAKFYNNALLAIEANFEGRWINAAIVEKGYHNVYYRQQVDDITKNPTRIYGWLTTGGKAGTKGVALMSLKAVMLRKDPTRLFPKVLLEEMLTFVMGDRSKVGAISGKHDDVIMATAIGYAVVFQLGKQVLSTDTPENASLSKTIWGESDVVNFG